MKISALLVALVSVAMMSGCASILNDQTQPINVSSSTGSDISGKIDGVAFKAPGIVNVVRANKDQIIAVDTAGCVNSTVLPKTVDPKFFINILSGGVLGSSTDYSTEKMWKYSESVVISCKK